MSFNAIRLAQTGLAAMQKALEVTGHNITNANTTGYHRQVVTLEAAAASPSLGNPATESGGQYGNGVLVENVRRMQDALLEQQLRTTQGQIGQYTALQDGVSQIESFLAPGTNTNLSTMLDKFFSTWDELSSQPELESSRLAVRSSAINLVNNLNTASSKLDYMAQLSDATIQDDVDRINLLADKLAAVNAQIGQAKQEGRMPNDLQDQREQILTELTSLAGSTCLSFDNEANSITNIGGHPLVEGIKAFHVKFDFVTVGGVTSRQVIWENDGTPASISTGSLAGLFELRDEVIPDYKSQLDTIASTLISSVNAKHVTGYTMDGATGQNFFTGTCAGDIQLDSNVMTSARNIAATTKANALGDGSLATEIYQLSTKQLIGAQTLNSAAQSLIGQIGNAVKTTQTGLDTVNSLNTQLSNQVQQACGVSLDEELTNMLVFQRSYDASARVLKAADEMVQSLLAMVQ